MLSLLKCRRGVLRWEMRERGVGFFGGRWFFGQVKKPQVFFGRREKGEGRKG